MHRAELPRWAPRSVHPAMRSTAPLGRFDERGVGLSVEEDGRLLEWGYSRWILYLTPHLMT